MDSAFLKKVLNEVFGLKDFRIGQLKIIEHILQKKDVFAIMPTGAGKSICFQLPAILFDGVTIVVSPLVALMNDQVSRLKKLGIKAVFLNKSITSGQIRKIMKDTVKGLNKIVYIAPERLESQKFFEFASNIKISLVVIDEAHCVLQWGIGFRSSYLKIAKFFEELKSRPIFAAFTATASLESIKEISELLKLKQPFVFSGGFERPNLFFDVIVVKDDLKIRVLLKIFKIIKNESTIIYCQTRRNVELVYLIFKKKGFKVAKYHAGLSHEIRRRSQVSFLADEVSVLVATNSFGMGIDKKDVRNVVHFNMPKSLEDYCQEAGRAGRDGCFSRCFMIFSDKDIEIDRFLIEKSVRCSNFSKEQLFKFRERNYRKLEQIRSYCLSGCCYSNQILRYFGEVTKQNNCFNCGNCLKNFINLGEIVVLIFYCINYSEGCCLKECEILKILKGVWFLNSDLKKNRLFGKLKKVSPIKIKVCVKELILRNYLIRTENGRVKLSKSAVKLFLSEGFTDFKFWVESKKIKKRSLSRIKIAERLLIK